MKPQTIKIDNVEYVRKDAQKEQGAKVDGMECVMIRTYSAGVHFGYLKRRDGKEVELVNAKRVFYWDGACSLSQLAVDGSQKSENCKISIAVDSIILTETIEIIPMTQDSITNLYGIQEWKK